MLAMQRPILPRYRPAYSYPRAIPYIFTVSVLPQTVFPLPLSRSRSPLRSVLLRFSQHAFSRKYREIWHISYISHTDFISISI